MTRECTNCGETATSSTQEYCEGCHEALPAAYGGSPEAEVHRRQAVGKATTAVFTGLVNLVVIVLIAAFAVMQLFLFSESRNKAPQNTQRVPLKRASISKM